MQRLGAWGRRSEGAKIRSVCAPLASASTPHAHHPGQASVPGPHVVLRSLKMQYQPRLQPTRGPQGVESSQRLPRSRTCTPPHPPPPPPPPPFPPSPPCCPAGQAAASASGSAPAAGGAARRRPRKRRPCKPGGGGGGGGGNGGTRAARGGCLPAPETGNRETQALSVARFEAGRAKERKEEAAGPAADRRAQKAGVAEEGSRLGGAAHPSGSTERDRPRRRHVLLPPPLHSAALPTCVTPGNGFGCPLRCLPAAPHAPLPLLLLLPGEG